MSDSLIAPQHSQAALTSAEVAVCARSDSNGRAALALESAGLAWWDQDFRSGKVTRSESWARMLGYDPHEIAAMVDAWKELVHPDDLPLTIEQAHLHELGKTDEFEVEHRMLAKDGSWRWILNWGRITERDEHGRPLRAIGTHLDITERKLAELEKDRRITELQEALSLHGEHQVIPICSCCKSIRNEVGSWQNIESYFRENRKTEFTHGLCPVCVDRLYPELAGTRDDADRS